MLRINFLVILFSISNLFAQPTTISGLKGYYKFQNNYADSSGNDYHGTANNVTFTNDVLGVPNNASSYNTNDSFINIGDIDDYENTNELTLSFWIKTDSSGNGVGSEVLPIMSKWFTSTLEDSCSWGLFIINDSIQFNVSDGLSTDRVNFPFTLDNNLWQYVSITFADGIVKYYLNGIEIESKIMTTLNIHNSNTHFKIGDWYHQINPSYLTFFGSLDEIAIYSRELNSEEIESLYNSYFLSDKTTFPVEANFYPTISNGWIYLNKLEENTTIKVYSLNGSLVMYTTITSNTLYLENLQNGVYLLQIGESNNQLQKFILKR